MDGVHSRETDSEQDETGDAKKGPKRRAPEAKPCPEGEAPGNLEEGSKQVETGGRE
jgi:hypothetical protein